MRWELIVWTADLGNQDRVIHRQLIVRINENELDCIVLDYVGHPGQHGGIFTAITDIWRIENENYSD